jgi:hypothetical protein
MPKYTVTFQINCDSTNNDARETLEYHLKDLLNSAVLPALNSELAPLTFTVRKARS